MFFVAFTSTLWRGRNLTRFINIEPEICFNAGGGIFRLAIDFPQTSENVVHFEKRAGVKEQQMQNEGALMVEKVTSVIRENID